MRECAGSTSVKSPLFRSGNRSVKRALRYVAGLATAAVALTGLVVADSIGNAPTASAVTFDNGWDGKYHGDQMWYKEVVSDARALRTGGDVNNIDPANFKRMFNPRGSANGTATSNPGGTVGFGPLFRHEKDAQGRVIDDSLQLVDIVTTSVDASTPLNNVTVYHSYVTGGQTKVDAVNYGRIYNANASALQIPANQSVCRSTDLRFSGGVSQRSGFLYTIVGGILENLSATSATVTKNTAVYKLASPSAQGDKITCVGATTQWVGAGGKSLNTQWQEQTGETVTATDAWRLASDLMIDAKGDVLVLAGQLNQRRQALIRVTVPKDADGVPIEGADWEFSLVKPFVSYVGYYGFDARGLAFAEGSFFTVRTSTVLTRWDPMRDAPQDLGEVNGGSVGDLATAQTPAVIEGTVYNDKNGNGVLDAGEQGLAGQDIEVFRNDGTEASPVWTQVGDLKTAGGGLYSILVGGSGAHKQYVVRLARPTVDGANAVQTFSTAGVFEDPDMPDFGHNVVRPYCATPTEDYKLVDLEPGQTTAACWGARRDGIDPTVSTANPSTLTGPLDANGGAAIVTRIDLDGGLAVAEADFGVTAAGSWGDSPAGYRSTNAQSGPYANPLRVGENWLFLGDRPGIYDDGVNSPLADAHATDDGLEFSASGGLVDDWVPAQGQIMAAGKTYGFRAKAGGNPTAVRSAFIKAWITSANASGVSTSFDQALLGGGACSPSLSGSDYVYCTYTAPTTLPNSRMATLFARARISMDSAVTPTTRGPSAAAASSTAWKPFGEVEDYALGAAPSVIRVKARTAGGFPAYVSLGFGNVSSTAPSSASDSILTTGGATYTASTQGHAVDVANSAVTIFTQGVGADDAADLGGWQLATGAGDLTRCVDTQSGADLGAAVAELAGTVTVPVGSGGVLPSDITCYLAYTPAFDASLSTVSADPSNNQGQELLANSQTSQVQVAAKGSALDKDGLSHPVAKAGATVTLTVAPLPGSTAPAGGAQFETSADGGTTWQAVGDTATCTTNASGACDVSIRLTAKDPGGYGITANSTAGFLTNEDSGQPSNTSPVPVWFRAGGGSAQYSYMTITERADQFANYLAPRPGGQAPGSQTITVTLRDSANLPYTSGHLDGSLVVSSPLNDTAPGVFFSNVVDGKGQFVCAEALEDGLCKGGEYTLDVYASRQGDKEIEVTHSPEQGAPFKIREETSQDQYVTAKFVTPPASAQFSVLVFSGVGESDPPDNWDDPTAEPIGQGVPHFTGHTFSLGIRVWDAGRYNPVGSADVRFKVDQSCSAVFLKEGTSGVKTLETTTSPVGKAAASLYSDVDESCEVTAQIMVEGDWVDLPKGPGGLYPKIATWQDSDIDIAESYYFVSDAQVVADGTDEGTVTVFLMGTSGSPVTTAAASLAGFGPDGGGITVRPFVSTGEGFYEAPFTGTIAGMKAITVRSLGQALSPKTGGNWYANMIAGAPWAEASWLVQSDVQAQAGDTATVPVVAKVFDKNGNAAESGSVVFHLPAGLRGSAEPISALDAAHDVTVPINGGQARVDVSARVATAYDVTASIAVEGEVPALIGTVKNAAETAPIGSDGIVKVKFVAGVPSSSASRLSIPSAGPAGTITKLVGGTEKHRAEVEVRDAFGNPADPGTAYVVFSATYTTPQNAPATANSGPVAVGAGGVAFWEFGSDAAVTWSVSATIQNVPGLVTNSPLPATFHAGELDVNQTLLSFTADSATKAADGDAFAEAKMQARDAYKNPLSGKNLGFALLYDPAQESGPLFDHAESGTLTKSGVSGSDGWVTARIYSVWPGQFDVTGVYETFRATPQKVNFSNKPASKDTSSFRVEPKSTNVGQPTPYADGSDGYTVTVTLRNAEGDLINGAGATVWFRPRPGVGGSAVRVPVQAGSAGRGTATVDLTTVYAGWWDVTVSIGDDLIGTDTDLSVKTVGAQFVAGPAVAGMSKLVSPTVASKANGTEQQVIVAEVRDQNGNYVGGEPVTFIIPENVTYVGDIMIGGAARVSVLTGTSGMDLGRARLPLISKVVNETGYEVTAELAAGPIEDGSPARARFTNADLSLGESEFTIPTDQVKKVVMSEYHTPQVQLKDSSGNNFLPQRTVTFYYKPESGSLWKAGPSIPTVNGFAEWSDFTVSEAGTYDVSAFIPEGQIPGADEIRKATFKAGPPDLGKSVWGATSGSVLNNDQDEHRAWVQLFDYWLNPVPDVTVDFTLDGVSGPHFNRQGCDPASCSVTTSSSGMAEVTVTSPEQADTRVTGLLGTDMVGTAIFSFKPGAASAEKSSWTITPTPPGPMEVSEETGFEAVVTVMDKDGLKVPDAEVTFDVPAAIQLDHPGPYISDDEGEVKVVFTSTVAGSFTVNALIGGAKVAPKDQVLKFDAGPISFLETDTYLIAPTTSQPADGETEQVVQARVTDKFGNPQTGAKVQFDVPVGTTAKTSPIATVGSNGLAELRLVSTVAKIHEVTASARIGDTGAWTEITGRSPAPVEFRAGQPSLTNSLIWMKGSSPQVADGEGAYEVGVDLKDANGNAIKQTGLDVTINFQLVDADGESVDGYTETRYLWTDGSGTVSTWFSTTKAGLWKATARLSAGQVTGGNPPLDLLFVPGDAIPGNSFMEVSQTNVYADGVSKHAAWVTAYDASGNPVPGVDVAFTVDQGSPVQGPDTIPANGLMTTGPDGVALVEITSEEPGSFPVHALIDGQPVKDSGTPVQFASGTAHERYSYYQLVPDTAASPDAEMPATGLAEDAYRLTVTARSDLPLLVGNAQVRLVGLDGTPVVITGDNPARTADHFQPTWGTYTWLLSSEQAGTFVGTIEVQTDHGWVALEQGPFTLNFCAGDPDVDNSYLIAPYGSVVANDSSTLEVRAKVRDALNNAVSGIYLTFSVPENLTATVGGQDTIGGSGVTVAVPVSTGNASVLFKSATAADYTVTAQLPNGAQITEVKDAQESQTINTTGQVPLTFTAGPAVPGTSVLSIPTAAGGNTVQVGDPDGHRAEVRTKDANGNDVGGALVEFRYGPDQQHMQREVVASDPTTGIATLWFTSNKAVTYTVEASVAGAQVVDSPQEATFRAGPFHWETTMTSLEVEQGSAYATGHHPLWAKMTAQDEFGNPIEGIVLGFELPQAGDGPVFEPLASGAKETTGTSGDNGEVVVNVVSVFHGTYPIVGVFDGQRTLPENLIFDDDAPDPERSWFTMTVNPGNVGQPARADGSDSYNVTVHLTGVLGHPMNGVQANVVVKNLATGEEIPHTVTTSQVGGVNGVAEFTLTSKDAGTFAVSVEVAGDQISQPTAGAPDKTALAVFVAGPPSGVTTWLEGPQSAPSMADGADQQVVTAHVFDLDNNPVAGSQVLFNIPQDLTAVGLGSDGTVTADGPALVAVPAGSNGEASLVTVSKVKGEYNVTATADGVAITRGSPAVVKFKNAPLSPNKSVFTVPTSGEIKMVREEFHTAQVELFDSSGNRFTDSPADVSFIWRLEGTSAWSGPQTVTSVGGIALWPSWTVRLAGTYEIQAYLGNDQVGITLTAEFKHGNAVPAAADFRSSAGNKVSNNGIASHFAEVTVWDAQTDRTPVNNEPVTFTVTGAAWIDGAPSDSPRTVVVYTSAQGVARINILDDKVGGETVEVTASLGAYVVGSALLDFYPGAADPTHSSWTVTPTQAISATHPVVVADGLDSYTATVSLFDDEDIAVTRTEVTFALPPSLRIVESGPYKTDDNGKLVVHVVTNDAGRWDMAAQIGADLIRPGSQTLEFGAGEPSAPKSFLESPRGTAVADGDSELTIKAHVFDGQDNAVEDVDVRFTFSSELTVVGQPSGLQQYTTKTDSDGIAILTVTSTVAKQHQILAFIDYVAPGTSGPVQSKQILENSPAIAEFVPGAISAARSKIWRTPASPLTAGLPDQAYTVSVELYDAKDNQVKLSNVGIDYKFFLAEYTGDPAAYCSQAADDNTRTDSALTNSAGVAAVRFVSNKAGPWYGCAAYNGQHVMIGSPVDLAFIANSADPNASRLVVSENPALANGSATHEGRVWVTDASGNPIGGHAVTMAITTGSSLIPGPFVQGTTVSTATVTTCDPADRQNAPAYCEVEGVFQPGLAVVKFVSREPGTFHISASIDGTEVTDSPRPVSFVSGTALGSKSSWSIDPNTADPDTGDEVSVEVSDSSAGGYQLTVSVESEASLPVENASVRIAGLPAAVQVDGPLQASTAGPDQVSFGSHTWTLYSQTQGEFHGRVQVQEDGGDWVEVGAPFTVRFHAGPVNPSRTVATFETYGSEVLNNLEDQSWARVQLLDRFGNGVGGQSVTFTLPASQPGTAGTPVFVAAEAAASGKEVTLVSCPARPADPTNPPATCLKAGVYTPGLAHAAIVSDYEGTFPVNASVGAVALGPGNVVFSAGAASAEASSFTLAKWDPSAPRVVADGAQGYALTVTVMNGASGSSLQPVSGACVEPQLPPGVSVAEPTAGTPCGEGEYVTDLAGQAKLKVVSTKAGVAQVGVKLGDSDIPTVPHGADKRRPAAFVPGQPVGARSELIGPKSSAAAKDPAGLTVTAALRDQFDNPAACWSGDDLVPCQVKFEVPEGDWAYQGSERVNGPDWVTVKASLPELDRPILPEGSSGGPAADEVTASLVYRGAPGVTHVTAQVRDQSLLWADGVNWAPNPAQVRLEFTGAFGPDTPTVDPSDGGSIGGDSDGPGDTITVKDKDGEVLCTTTVQPNGTWSCTLQPPAEEGDIVTIVAEDDSGLTVEKDWRIGIPRMVLAKETICGGGRQAVTGENFQPGEAVTLAALGAPSGAEAVAVASADGVVQFEWTVPANATGAQKVTLTGPLSRGVDGQFACECPAPPPPLPFTGAANVIPIAGLAAGLLFAGWLLWLAARRRRESQRETNE
ncbi:MAG: Ig-like domain-containing protein [Bifidobacteriaceae bacterium]|jgi:hypothetical protein|nr:Ig-like domain-containing protein [Bifidobacteriaceae bacterium]